MAIKMFTNNAVVVNLLRWGSRLPPPPIFCCISTDTWAIQLHIIQPPVVSLSALFALFSYIMRSSAITDTVLVEILSTATKLYEKLHYEEACNTLITLKVTVPSEMAQFARSYITSLYVVMTTTFKCLWLNSFSFNNTAEITSHTVCTVWTQCS